MGAGTRESQELRRALALHRRELDAILSRYGARNPRLFGSVARGEATPGSDLDLLVDLDDNGANPLMRVAGIAEELGSLLGVRVDVAAEGLLREPVSASAYVDAVPL